MIPAFANVTRGNAKKVKVKGHPFYFATSPDTKRQVFFIGQSPGKAVTFAGLTKIAAHLRSKGKGEPPLPKTARFCAGTVVRDNSGSLIFDVTVKKGVSTAAFLRMLLKLNLQAKMNLGVIALSGPADDVEEGGEIVEATPEELAASEAESEEGSDSVDPDADLQDPNANLNDPNVNPSGDPNAPPQERDPNAPEPKPDLSHIPPLRAQMKARAKAMKLKDSGVYAYVPEAMDGRPMLLLSQPGGAVASRMRMVGPVGEEGRYRCTALGSIALTHGSFSLGPLARHLGVKLRFAPIPVEKPRKIEAVPVTIPVPPPPTSGLLRRPRADTILAPASGLSNRVLTGARGKIMAVGLQEGGRVTLTTSPPKVERITFSGGGGKGAALPGAVRALERSGVLKDLKEISGASVGSMTAAMVAVGVTAEEFEEMGNDPSVAAQIKEGKNMVEVLFGGGLDGLGLENLVRAKASDCLRKRLSEHIEAQESSGAEVEPEVHHIFNRLADGKKGPTFGELRILSKIIPAVKEVAISGSYVAELDGATKRPLPQAKPQLVMFNADTEPDMEIALAVHASAALPPVFKSVDLQLSSGIWVRFQDGGVLNNAPAAETLGVERNLDPLPESGGMTFVFEEEASKEIVKGKAVPRRDRVADWITGAGNSAAEYAKNRALADRPEDVVVVPLSFKAPDGDKKDFSGLLSGTTNFNMDVQDKLTLQSMTDDATTAHIRQRQQPKTREFASMKEMLMSISAADLDALCDQQVEGAPEALAYRVEVEQQVNELRARMKKSGPRELATDPETRVLLDHLEQQAVGKEEKEFLARTFNRFPDLDALLDVMREKDPHPVLGGALVVNDGLRAQAHARTLLQELIYPKMVKTDHKGSAGQMLKLVDDRLRAVRTPAEVNSILDMAATHFRNRPDLFGYFGHKQFAADLEKRRMNLRANL